MSKYRETTHEGLEAASPFICNRVECVQPVVEESLWITYQGQVYQMRFCSKHFFQEAEAENMFHCGL